MKSKIKTQPENQQYSYERFANILIWLGIVIIFLTTAIYAFDDIFAFFIERFGEYGEYIGGLVGSIWALAGVILFYEALRVQRTEMKMQRHELEMQRHDMLEQTEQFKQQNQFMAMQTFDNTFFQMVTLHNEIVESITMEIREQSVEGGTTIKPITGRAAFVEYYQIYKRFFYASFEEIKMEHVDDEMSLELIDNSFQLFFEESQSNLGHYFRNLFSIVNLVDSRNLKNKKFYIDLIRAQLSNYELLLLFFHCLSRLGDDFKPLIEKYSLFNNLPHDELISVSRRYYDKKAFTENDY